MPTLVFCDVFHHELVKRELEFDIKASVNNRGMTYDQNDEKRLSKTIGYLVGGG